MSPEKMLTDFVDNITQNNLFSGSDKVLLAVSGGADSVVMAQLFYRAGFKFSIAHCNFMLRGVESDGDELFCADLAARWGVSFFSTNFDTTGYASQRGISVQMAARELRYEWFSGLKKKHGFRFVATAHHQDDHVETILINLARGTGIDGMKGIPVRSEDVIRPLWWFTGNQIRDYAKTEGLNFREDSSNHDNKYMRNKVRHDIVPVFKEINPSFATGVVRLSSIIEKFSDTFSILLRDAFSGYIKHEGNKIIIDTDPLAKYPATELVLYELLRRFGFSAPVTSQIADALARQPGKVFYSATHQCVKDRRSLIVSPLETNDLIDQQFSLNSANETLTLPNGFIIAEEILAHPQLDIAKDPSVAYLDMEKISFPILVRHPKPGDFFVPFGMSGKKKISDYLTDIKMPVNEKQKVWVFCNGNDIIWVLGFRTDNRYRVSNETKSVLKIKFNTHYG